MKTLKIPNGAISERQLSETARALKEGEIAIIPTDTIYAIVCDALNSKAIERICALKGINPEKSNLSIISPHISMAAEYARIDNNAFRLIRENTPGAFTFLLPTTRQLPKAFKGRKVVGVRIPDAEIPRQIAERLGNPLLCTSIQFEDADYAREPSLISEAYDGRVDLMIEGPDGDDIPSTILDLTGPDPVLVRAGKAPF